jgi:hypothetical protein
MYREYPKNPARGWSLANSTASSPSPARPMYVLRPFADLPFQSLWTGQQYTGTSAPARGRFTALSHGSVQSNRSYNVVASGKGSTETIQLNRCSGPGADDGIVPVGKWP